MSTAQTYTEKLCLNGTQPNPLIRTHTQTHFYRILLLLTLNAFNCAQRYSSRARDYSFLFVPRLRFIFLSYSFVFHLAPSLSPSLSCLLALSFGHRLQPIYRCWEYLFDVA